MEKYFDLVVDMLSTLIATAGQHEVHVPRSELQIEGEQLTSGWPAGDLSRAARAVTVKFHRGNQYDYVVSYSPDKQEFIGLSKRARDELLRRLG
jgi:hypothetical protein